MILNENLIYDVNCEGRIENVTATNQNYSERILKFIEPPANVIQELQSDTVIDIWEVHIDHQANSSMYDYQPIIGILT